MFMAILIKSDHMVSVYLLLFKTDNHKYALLDHMTFLFIVKWPYENQHDHKPLKVTMKWPYDEFGEPYDSFMVSPHPQCRRIISENIYLFFNTYKTKIFPTIPSLQAELIQFRQGAKGIEYLHHLMKKRHPRLTRSVSYTHLTLPTILLV